MDNKEEFWIPGYTKECVAFDDKDGIGKYPSCVEEIMVPSGSWAGGPFDNVQYDVIISFKKIIGSSRIVY